MHSNRYTAILTHAQNQLMKSPLSTALAVILTCTLLHSEPPAAGHAANEHMHKADFEKLVARFEDPERVHWQKPEKVIELLGPLAGRTLADIGAGTGYFVFPIAKRADKVIAIDIDERFIHYMDRRKQTEKAAANIETRLTAPDAPGLKAAEADVVLIVNTYHHIDERTKYLQKLKAGLRKDGMLVIVDFKKEKTPNGPPLELRLTEAQIESELTAAGFSVLSSDRTLLPEQYIIRAR